MAVFNGSYVQTGLSSIARINTIVDTMLTPRLLDFRQICIYSEPATLMNDGTTWNLTYGNWNPDFGEQVYYNSGLIETGYTVNRTIGTVTITGGVNDGDTVDVTYNFDWFGIGILEGFIYQVIDFINTGAYGPPTQYTIADAPTYWNGVITDLAFALTIEKLILDYDLWKGRLIFAIPNIEEGGDILGALETLKSNAETRASKTLDNERFKVPPYQSAPTETYYAAVRGIGRSGVNSGKLRGWKPSRYI